MSISCVLIKKGQETMTNIGEKLRNKRLEKKLSLEDISKRTKIQKRVLEALEQNKAEEILGPVYAKSFLKKYNLFLGLEISEALNGGSPAKTANPFILNIGAKKKKNTNWQKVIPLVRNIILISVVIIITGFLSIKIVRFMHKSPISSTAASPTKKEVTSPPASSTKMAPSRLLLKTKKDVWVQIKIDGHIVSEGILKKASQEEWAFKEEMRLWVGNGAFVELTLNGKYYGSPGRGVIKNIIVTKEGIKVK